MYARAKASGDQSWLCHDASPDALWATGDRSPNKSSYKSLCKAKLCTCTCTASGDASGHSPDRSLQSNDARRFVREQAKYIKTSSIYLFCAIILVNSYKGDPKRSYATAYTKKVRSYKAFCKALHLLQIFDLHSQQIFDLYLKETRLTNFRFVWVSFDWRQNFIYDLQNLFVSLSLKLQ